MRAEFLILAVADERVGNAAERALNRLLVGQERFLLLRLGQALSALGAKEQACATFSEIPRKYPNAPAMVKTGADREAKRSQC